MSSGPAAARPRPHGVSAPWWEDGRPYLTRAALRLCAAGIPGAAGPGGDADVTTRPALASYPRAAQDCVAADDLLSALLGVPGSFARPRQVPASAAAAAAAIGAAAGGAGAGGRRPDPRAQAPIRFELEPAPGADPAVPALAARVLGLADDHVEVAEFVEKNRVAKDAGGYVRQALAVALADLLEDYRAFVLQLETALRAGDLTLQRLLFYAQPSMRSMALLRRIVAAVEGKTGGAALHAVYELAAAHVGSADAREVLTFVVGRAAAPILDCMHTWMAEGMIEDAYGEFFVEENTRYAHSNMRDDPSSATSWGLRYTVNKENIPGFLGPFVEHVLRAGKYVNVLRESNVNVADLRKDAPLDRIAFDGRILLGPDSPRHIAACVDRAYLLSSSQLMNYLHSDVDAFARLRSIKRYFTLEQGDFLVHFFDAAADELRKKKSDVSLSKLSSLLELSVRTSLSAADPYHDDLGCVFLSTDFTTQILTALSNDTGATGAGTDASIGPRLYDAGALTGYDTFGLSFAVRWPLTLVVSGVELLKYQLLFRYIFHCKHVERELEGCWRNLAQVKGSNRSLRYRFARTFALRHRMLQMLRNMLYYIVADVVEPNWQRFEAAFKDSKTIDEIMVHHARFLDTCLSQCLLSSERHLRVFHSVTKVCLLFATYTGQFTRELENGTSAADVAAVLDRRNYADTISKFEATFGTNLHKLLDTLSTMSKRRASTHLANLCDRLDFDGFYERSALQSAALLE